MSTGYFRTPSFERYVRSGSTVIDAARPTVVYLEVGPGIAIWPTRTLNVHIEGGGMIGSSFNRASLVLPTSDNTGVVASVFGGVGVNYRLPSYPWAIGFDYRIQGIPYGGFASGERVDESGFEIGHSLFGVGHSFGLSAILRFERDRDD